MAHVVPDCHLYEYQLRRLMVYTRISMFLSCFALVFKVSTRTRWLYYKRKNRWWRVSFLVRRWKWWQRCQRLSQRDTRRPATSNGKCQGTSASARQAANVRNAQLAVDLELSLFVLFFSRVVMRTVSVGWFRNFCVVTAMCGLTRSSFCNGWSFMARRLC